MSSSGTAERKPAPAGTPARAGLSRRTILGFVAAFGLTIALIVAGQMILTLQRQDEEDRIFRLQRALFGVDELVENRFRFPDKVGYVRADLQQAAREMKPGHVDRRAFDVLTAVVAGAAQVGPKSTRAQVEALSRPLTALAQDPCHEQIRKRAQALAAWLDEEAGFLAEIEAAEAAVAREEFDAVGGIFAHVAKTSPLAPRVVALRESLAAARGAAVERDRRQEEERVELVRQTWEGMLGRAEKAVATGRVDEAQVEMDRVAADVPDWAVARFRDLRERLSVEQVRAQAEKAYLMGKGTAVMGLLQERREPELVALRERVAKVVMRYEALLRAEDEGRPSEVERMVAELSVLEPSPSVWYREQALRLANADPAARAARWLDRGVQKQGRGELADARRLMEAAREVNPGAAAENAIASMLSSIQKEINLVSSSVRSGKIDPAAALAKIDALMAGLRPEDKYWDKVEDLRRDLKK